MRYWRNNSNKNKLYYYSCQLLKIFQQILLFRYYKSNIKEQFGK